MAREDSLEVLKKKLYDRDWKGGAERGRSELRSLDIKEKREWEASTPNTLHTMSSSVEKPMSLISKLLFGSLLFFSLCVAIAGAVLYFKLGVSDTNVDMVIQGPTSVAGGELSTFTVTITNKDSKPLLNSTLIIEYPNGTRDAADPAKTLTRERIPLGEIKSGEVVNRTIKAILYGSADSKPEIAAGLEYNLPESMSLFSRSESYSVTLSAAPVDVYVEMPKEINADQEITATVRIVSNAKTTLKNVAVRVDFPYGFVVKSTDPDPSQGASFWRLGDLSSGAERTVTIVGTPQSDSNESEGISATVGTEDSEDAGSLSIVYNTAFGAVSVAEPYLTLSSTLNGNTAKSVIAPADKEVRGVISWKNSTDSTISSGVLVLELSGNVDPSSVTVGNDGYYNSRDNTITWDKRVVERLGSIEAGGNGNVQFTFKPKALTRSSAALNPSAELSISFAGTRTAEGFSQQNISSVIARSVKFATQVSFSADGYYSIGPIKNSGPIPPKLGSETTYTITWALVNPSNNVTSATVEAVLPVYVVWKGVTSPVNESVIYNESTHTVTWDLQYLKSGVGVGGTAPRTASFQVGINPSLSQVGETPTLVLQSLFKGTDTFTEKTVTTEKPAITTRIVKDPVFRSGSDQVIQ